METAIMAVRLGWTAYVIPFLFVYSPNLIMQGEPMDIIRATITAVVGVWAASSGLMGYLFSPLSLTSRIGMLIGGLGLLVPATVFKQAPLLEMAGGIIVILSAGREYWRRASVKGLRTSLWGK